MQGLLWNDLLKLSLDLKAQKLQLLWSFWWTCNLWTLCWYWLVPLEHLGVCRRIRTNNTVMRKNFLCITAEYLRMTPEPGFCSGLKKINWNHVFNQLQSFTHGTSLICVNRCAGVEHKQKSSDYQPLMNVINRCEMTHLWCQWASRYLQHIQNRYE